MSAKLARCCLFVAFLLSACASRSTEPQPPVIIYGQDVCDECGMLISEARYAAATLVVDGEPHKFESIGDMVLYHMERPDQTVRAWFVHDYNSEVWVAGEAAFYVVSAEIHSPMGVGIAAFETQADAETFAASLGVVVMTFDEMRAAVHVLAHH